MRLLLSLDDVLPDLDLEVVLRDQSLQARVFLLHLTHLPQTSGFDVTEALTPGVDRLLAQNVALCHFRYPRGIRFPQNADYPFFCESTVSHGSHSVCGPVSLVSNGLKISGQVSPAISGRKLTFRSAIGPM